MRYAPPPREFVFQYLSGGFSRDSRQTDFTACELYQWICFQGSECAAVALDFFFLSVIGLLPIRASVKELFGLTPVPNLGDIIDDGVASIQNRVGQIRLGFEHGCRM